MDFRERRFAWGSALRWKTSNSLNLGIRSYAAKAMPSAEMNLYAVADIRAIRPELGTIRYLNREKFPIQTAPTIKFFSATRSRASEKNFIRSIRSGKTSSNPLQVNEILRLKTDSCFPSSKVMLSRSLLAFLEVITEEMVFVDSRVSCERLA